MIRLVRVDWGDGDYGRTAAVLAPAATAVFDRVGVVAGRRVLDVGCGTGNALLEAARRGARVTGVDPSPTLVDIARRRTREAGLEAETLVGDAAALPVADGSFDVVVSVFAVIFASDPRAAAAGLVRAARPGATVAVTTWTEEGPIAAAGRVVRGALARSDPAPVRFPARTGWDTLLEETGIRDVTTTAADLAFTAASPQAWFDEQERHHPMWRAARRTLSDGAWATVRAESLSVLDNGNEDPAAFRTMSCFCIVRGTSS